MIAVTGCRGSESIPTAPTSSAVAETAPADISTAVSGVDRSGEPPTQVNYPSAPSGPQDVVFPPRNEPLLFRTALEAKYRDGLRRASVLTFVDQEGTIVWTQEYLRYRVNLCPHTEAIVRVFRQIDGQGIPPTCGATSTATFPPRNEPLEFMVQLEAKYRDGLRRTAAPSFVDVEGNIVWTQEYLRYRVSLCAHAEAQQKVFDQIDGRGVQSDCSASGLFNGTWRGTARSTGCSASGAFANQCGSSLVDTLTLSLTQSGIDVRGTINFGGVVAPATGTANGNRLVLSGRTTFQSLTVSYESWDTSLSGSSMIGSFVFGVSSPGVPGFVRQTMTLSSVAKTAAITSTVDRNLSGAGNQSVAAALAFASPRLR